MKRGSDPEARGREYTSAQESQNGPVEAMAQSATKTIRRRQGPAESASVSLRILECSAAPEVVRQP